MNAQEILQVANEKGGDRFRFKDTMWLTQAGQVVSADSFSALWVLPKTIPMSLAKSLGLDKADAGTETPTEIETDVPETIPA